MSLSRAQIEHLKALDRDGPRSAYPGLRLGTLYALRNRGLVESKSGPGSMAFPQVSIEWSITGAGRIRLRASNPYA